MTSTYRQRRVVAKISIVLLLSVGAMVCSPEVDAASASLYLSPSSSKVNVDDTLTVTVYVKTDVAINAAEATVTFPTSLLKVVSVTKGGLFTLWPGEPSYSNTTGKISFAGGLPSPGYKGSSGKILSIVFLARAEGKPRVSVTGGRILENSAEATDILTAQGSGTYTIAKPTPPPVNRNATPPTNTNTSPPSPPSTLAVPAISSSTMPEPDQWYASRTLTAAWTGGSGVQGYSVLLNEVADATPPETVTTTDGTFTRTDVADGTWYLHLRAKYASGWSTTVHQTVRVDATPPEPFSIAVVGDPEISFVAWDAKSGVDHYEISLDGGRFASVTSPYQTPELDVGSHRVVVRAFDKAGNMREVSTSFEVVERPQPVVIDLTPVLVGGEPMVVRGFSGAQDSIRLTVGDVDYGPYPVADHLDPNPPTPPSEGQVAWKIELSPELSDGEHEVTVVSIGPDGRVSTSTPPLKFRIQRSAVRIANRVVPTALVVNILAIVVVVLAALMLFFALLFWRLRRRVYRTRTIANLLNPPSEHQRRHWWSRR